MPALAGLRVLDFTSGFAGAIATMVLSDNGAEVIKVEPPRGDVTRAQPAHVMWHRGKKSVVLDLKRPEASATAVALAREADVVVESMRPGVADRLGIGQEALRAVNPGLVYCSITGFGSRGPDRFIKGYEGSVAARVGRFAREDGWRPSPVFFPIPVLSYAAGQLALQGVMAALLARDRTGKGQWVQTSLVQSAMVYANSGWMVRVGEESTAEAPKVPWVSPHEKMAAGYQIAQGADGKWIQIASTTVRLFRAFMRVLGMEYVYDDSRFSDMPYVFPTPEERTEVLAEVRRRLGQKSVDEWMRLFEEDGNVGAEPFITTEEAMSHPQFIHNGSVVEIEDPRLGVTSQIGPLAVLSDTPAEIGRSAPALGEHTEELLGAVTSGESPWRPRNGTLPAPEPEPLRHPLQGTVVLELGNHIAGPFGCTLLAEMGARVIKVEPPEGDLLRRIMDASVKTIQGKESIAIDLKTERGRAILYKLVARADVLMHNFRPGVEEKLGIGYEKLAALNPRLIYLYAASYGSSGPRAGRPAFGPALNAIAGAGPYIAGEGNPPLMSIHADPSSALGVATAALLGLSARQRTGRGQYIETTMLSSTAYALSDDFIRYKGKPPRRMPDKGQHGFHALYRLYETKEGWLFLICSQPGEWDSLCRVTGRPELVKDPRFETRKSREANDAALTDILSEALRSRPAGEWERLFLEADLACLQADGPSFKAFFVQDPSVRENGFIARTQYVDYFEHKDHYVDFGEYWRHGNTVLFSDLEGVAGPPCGIGDHTQAILSEVDYSEEEIEELKAAGVVTWGLGWAAHG